jgi:hypothetical protein
MPSPTPVIYLDNNATTRVADEVIEAMLPFLKENYGNPSSTHTFGGNVARSLRQARENVAALLGADPEEIVFTSGGTEGNNAAIRAALAANPEKKHIVTTRVEHPAILNPCRKLERQGYATTYLRCERKRDAEPARITGLFAGGYRPRFRDGGEQRNGGDFSPRTDRGDGQRSGHPVSCGRGAGGGENSLPPQKQQHRPAHPLRTQTPRPATGATAGIAFEGVGSGGQV